MYCPANTHKKEINKDERLATETKCSLQIKKIFIEDFDVIAKIVNHYSDVYYSKKEKLELFKNAYNAKIWLFPKIDMSNIPWILLYCKSAEEIKQKLIKNDSNLYDFLKSKKVILKPSAKVKNYSFIEETDYKKVENMYYSFTFHNRYIDKNDEYKETICAVLTRSNLFNDQPNDGHTEYLRNKIKINHQELYNKIKFYNEKNYRDQDLLKEVKAMIKFMNSRP